MTNTKKCEPAVRKQQLAPPQQTVSKSPSVLLSQWSELCSQSVCNSHISSHLSGAIPPLEGGNDKVPLLLFWPKKRKKKFYLQGRKCLTAPGFCLCHLLDVVPQRERKGGKTSFEVCWDPILLAFDTEP